jgi:predicted PurR-regulated permease PerM
LIKDPMPSASTRQGSSHATTRRRRFYLLLVSAVIVIGVIIAARDVILPFVLALVLAYVLMPLVAWVERLKMPRGAAIVLVYVVVLGSFWLFVRGATPRISQELRGIRGEIPTLVNTARDEWVPAVQDRLRAFGIVAPPPAPPELAKEDAALVARPRPDGSIAIEIGTGVLVTPTNSGGYAVTHARSEKYEHFDVNKVLSDLVFKSFAYAETNALEIALIGRNIVAEVSRAIFIFGITLMLAAYLMLTRDRIIRFFTLLVRPSARGDFTLFLARMDKGLAGVVRGQLTISLINGTLSAIGFAFVGLKYWPVLALVATVFSLIPIFGSIASAVPAVALGLTQSVGTAIFVLLWIVGIHQIEANVLNPKIMGDAAKIHPVLVIFSLLVGEHFFHIVGALLAVPCMSIAQTVFQHLRDVIEREDPEFASDPRALSSPPTTPAGAPSGAG